MVAVRIPIVADDIYTQYTCQTRDLEIMCMMILATWSVVSQHRG